MTCGDFFNENVSENGGYALVTLVGKTLLIGKFFELKVSLGHICAQIHNK